MAEFHIRAAAAEKPIPAFVILPALFAHGQLAYARGYGVHVECNVLKLGVFVRINNVVMSGKYYRVSRGAAAHERGHYIAPKRVSGHGNGEYVFTVRLEIIKLVKHIEYNFRALYLIRRAGYAFCRHQAGKIAPYVSLVYHSMPLRFFRFIHNDTITAPEKLYIKNKGRARYGFSPMRILCG